MLLSLLLLAAVVLAAIAFAPSKPQPSGDALRQASLPAPTFLDAPTAQAPPMSLREAQLAEESRAIAAAYQEKSNKAWLENLTKDASALLAKP